jgi:membrane associated rhomboid family serine protease
LTFVAGTLISIWVWDVATLPGLLSAWAIWIAGRSTEDAAGRFRFALFCVVVVAAAAAAHDLSNGSPAEAAVMALAAATVGAYIRLYPRGRIQTLVLLPVLASLIEAPALLIAAGWFILQALVSQTSAGGETVIWLPVIAAMVGAVAISLLRTSHNPASGRRSASRTDSVPAA